MTVISLINSYDSQKSYDRTSLQRGVPFGYANATAAASTAVDTVTVSSAAVDLKEAKRLKEQGNEYIKNNDYQGAVACYQKSVEIAPEFVDGYYNLGKAYRTLGNQDAAIQAYTKLLEIEPENIEVITNLGQCYKDKKRYPEAVKQFKKAIEIEPKFDLATRELRDTENLQIESVNPMIGRMRKFEQSKKNIKAALELVKQYYPPEVIDRIKGVAFMFDKTGSMSGHQNIAQYENYNNRTVVTDDYIWAAPQVVAAYLVHEVIHAKDQDPYTSIKEEQDAYEQSVIFWQKFNNGIKDPEMDYAAELYTQSPASLADKVAEIYSSRDTSIPQYSPNHGIGLQSLGYTWFKMKNVFCKILPVSNKAMEFSVIADDRLYSHNYK